jgi:hypothetical protein
MFPAGPGADAMNGNCLACHSANHTLNQPTLPRNVWAEAVDKMINVYKAPITPQDAATIVDYLARTTGTTLSSFGRVGAGAPRHRIRARNLTGINAPVLRVGHSCSRGPYVNQEAKMKQLFLVGAAALILVSLLPDVAAAQRGRGGIGIGGGGFRGAAIGGGGGLRGIGGGGYRGVGIGGLRTAAIGGGGVGRASMGRGWGRGWGGAGWRRGRGWGFPIAAGLAAAGAWGYYGYGSSYDDYASDYDGYASYGGYGPYGGYASYGGYGSYDGYGSSGRCVAWNGNRWVNVCYSPSGPPGGGQYLPPLSRY